jgi:hypothetical protein
LTIGAHGRFEWRRRAGASVGALVPYAPIAGGTGWVLRNEREQFYAMLLPEDPDVLYLFSPATESEVFRARRAR